MSLINDALKRASKVQPPPPPTPVAETPLRPVEYRRSSPAWLVAAIVPLVLVLACVAFYKGWQAQRTAHLSAGTMPVAAREPVAPPTENPDGQTPDQPAGSPRASTAMQPRSKTPARAPAPATASNDAPASTNDLVFGPEPAKPTFPVVRLQGVFYRSTNPLVMINAKTLRIGEKIAGVKVVAIDRESVTLEWNGETKVLTLE
jgi:hypothetical protein